MTDATDQTQEPCERASAAAAYLDGELDAAESARFERHTAECPACRAALAEQRRLLCLLDAAFHARGPERGVPLPKDFTRAITARAQTDMSGVRRPSECLFAFKLCLGLAAVAAALLGAGALRTALAPLVSGAGAVAGVAGLAGHAVADAGAGAAVVLRAVGGWLVGAPEPLQILMWALLAGATALLLRLISGYHRRARLRD